MKIEWRSLWLGIGLSIYAAGCNHRSGAEQAFSPAELPLKSCQVELLDLAFGAASAMPADPHIKDRCAAQETVVTVCLGLGQPQRALRYLEQIQNWRRGADYADLALYCVQHGATSAEVEPYLERAAQAAIGVEDWQRDRINVKIARTRAYLGQTEQAAQLSNHVEPAETGKVATVKAMISSDDAFDEQMREVDALVARGHFDVLRNALDACVQLFDRFYADAKRRGRVEEKIKTSWDKLPVFVRMEFLMALSESALRHTDQGKALELVNEAQRLMDASRWPLEHSISTAARLCAVRFRAGDKEKAHQEADALRGRFDAEGQTIVNIYRAGVLRPLAETYQVMGDTASALEVYKKAVEAGVENPNSRPRAEDLTATCCSMAVNGVEPDAGLLQRIREIQSGLGDPW